MNAPLRVPTRTRTRSPITASPICEMRRLARHDTSCRDRQRPSITRRTAAARIDRRRVTMKFMCLVYNDDAMLEAMPEAEFWAFSDAHVAVDEELKRSGHSLAAEALQPAKTAKTVRVRGGKRARHRRPLRRGQGGGGRDLPARGQGHGRGGRAGGAHPVGQRHRHRGAPGVGAADARRSARADGHSLAGM